VSEVPGISRSFTKTIGDEDEFIRGIEQSANSVNGVKEINVYITPVLPFGN
jgi:hypothetical protein